MHAICCVTCLNFPFLIAFCRFFKEFMEQEGSSELLLRKVLENLNGKHWIYHKFLLFLFHSLYWIFILQHYVKAKIKSRYKCEAWQQKQKDHLEIHTYAHNSVQLWFRIRTCSRTCFSRIHSLKYFYFVQLKWGNSGHWKNLNVSLRALNF